MGKSSHGAGTTKRRNSTTTSFLEPRVTLLLSKQRIQGVLIEAEEALELNDL